MSRVINKEPNVRSEMMERVQASISKLGYVPSIAAQRMGGSRSYLIMALNDRDRTVADWRERQGRDWVDQMLLGGMLTCAEHGYRMIVELVDTHSDHIERELQAAIAALQPDGVILTPPHSQNPLIINLLPSLPAFFVDVPAIVASSDPMAIGALTAVRECGLQVPHDISLVSFDDTPIVRFTHPPLTSVVQPIADTIARAVELIIDEQAGRTTPDGLIVVPSGLTVRESTARPA